MNELKIAICDDETLQLKLLEKYCISWLSKNKLQYALKTYTSSEAFLFDYEDSADYDILLLDIQMKELSGIDLAKRLRAFGDDSAIIFITGIKDFVFEGYHVQAVDYVLKPVDNERIEAVLDRAYTALLKKEPNIIVQTDGDLVRLNERDIQYIESVGHNTLFYTAGETYTVKKGISLIENELTQKYFYKCHRSYIINILHIDSISKTDVKVNGSIIPIARGKWENLNKAFLNYYRGEMCRL